MHIYHRTTRAQYPWDSTLILWEIGCNATAKIQWSEWRNSVSLASFRPTMNKRTVASVKFSYGTDVTVGKLDKVKPWQVRALAHDFEALVPGLLRLLRHGLLGNRWKTIATRKGINASRIAVLDMLKTGIHFFSKQTVAS